MNICIQILDVIDIIKEKERLSFPDATVTFYHSRTYKALQNTENALWAESAGYIAARSFICLSGKCNGHIGRYGKEYFPISISEHLKVLEQCGFENAEIIWVSNMQAGLLGIK